MDSTMKIIMDLAVILLATKALGMLMRKIGLPQVVGMVIAGLLIGPAIWGQFGWWSPIQPTAESKSFFDTLGEIGVIMILFSAGLETDVKELKNTGLTSCLVAFGGVLVPLVGGFLIAIPFLGGFDAVFSSGALLLEAVIVGVILTATSVGITVETLKEMGKLRTKVGTITLSAAIIDDVIGIVVLSLAMAFKDPNVNPVQTVFMTLLFFVCAIGVGIVLNRFFAWYERRYPHNRRVPIFGLVVCFVYAFCAEKLFGVADITGAYIAGIILSVGQESHYIDRKIDINTYMIFGPVFFANIGINIDFSGFDLNLLLFSLIFVATGILGKIVGAGGVARLAGFNTKESAQIGVGMIARGEVALVVCKKALGAGIFGTGTINPLIATIMLVIVSSLLAPILLKLLYRDNHDAGVSGGLIDKANAVGECADAGMVGAAGGEDAIKDSALATDCTVNAEFIEPPPVQS